MTAKKTTIKTFTSGSVVPVIEFKLDEETYTALPANKVPAFTLIRYSEDVSKGKLLEAHKDLFEKTLTGENAKDFLGRLEGGENPINLELMINIAEYLVEAYSK